MADNDHIDKLVEDTLNSMDQHKKAMPRPYLLSRINARLGGRYELTLWDKITSVITRPAVAMACIVLVIMLNIIIISSNKNIVSYNYQQGNLTDANGFSISSTSAVYDIENIEP